MEVVSKYKDFTSRLLLPVPAWLKQNKGVDVSMEELMVACGFVNEKSPQYGQCSFVYKRKSGHYDEGAQCTEVAVKLSKNTGTPVCASHDRPAQSTTKKSPTKTKRAYNKKSPTSKYFPVPPVDPVTGLTKPQSNMSHIPLPTQQLVPPVFPQIQSTPTPQNTQYPIPQVLPQPITPPTQTPIYPSQVTDPTTLVQS